MYVNVNIKDFRSFKKAPVDIYVYLPLNGKFIVFIKNGNPVSRLEILMKKNLETVFIHFKDLKNFLKKRENFSIDESKEFYDLFKSNSPSIYEKSKELVFKILSKAEEVDFSYIAAFTSDIISIMEYKDYGDLYFALNNISHLNKLKHSQMVASLCILTGLLKKFPPMELATMAIAASLHEIPAIMLSDIEEYSKGEEPRLLSSHFVKIFSNLAIPSSALSILNRYHGGKHESEDCKILLAADKIVHSKITSREKIVNELFK